MIFVLVNLCWGDIGVSGKQHTSSTQKPQVSIKSQTGVMAKKLPKITIFERLRDFWFGEFVVRWHRTIRKVTYVIHEKTPGLYQVPNWSYGQETAKNHHFWEIVWVLVWWICGEVIWDYQESNICHPRENTWSLLSPKMEL